VAGGAHQALGKVGDTVSRFRSSPDQIVRACGLCEVDDLVLPLGKNDHATRGRLADTDLDDTAAPGDTAGFYPGNPPPVEAGPKTEGEECPRSASTGLGRLVGGIGSEQVDLEAVVGSGDVSRRHGLRARLPGR